MSQKYMEEDWPSRGKMDVFRQLYWVFGLTSLIGAGMGIGVLAGSTTITAKVPVICLFGAIWVALPWVIFAPRPEWGNHV